MRHGLCLAPHACFRRAPQVLSWCDARVGQCQTVACSPRWRHDWAGPATPAVMGRCFSCPSQDIVDGLRVVEGFSHRQQAHWMGDHRSDGVLSGPRGGAVGFPPWSVEVGRDKHGACSTVCLVSAWCWFAAAVVERGTAVVLGQTAVASAPGAWQCQIRGNTNLGSLFHMLHTPTCDYLWPPVSHQWCGVTQRS